MRRGEVELEGGERWEGVAVEGRVDGGEDGEERGVLEAWGELDEGESHGSGPSLGQHVDGFHERVVGGWTGWGGEAGGVGGGRCILPHRAGWEGGGGGRRHHG